MDVFGNTQALLTTVITSLYTCPERASVTVGSVAGVTASAEVSNVQAQITSIIVTEIAGGAATYSLWVTPDGTTPALAEATQIASSVSISANEVHMLSHGLVLAPGMRIWGQAGADNDLVITINHIEVL